MDDDPNTMEIDPEIAAAMGFSAFGNQRAQGSRRRKADEEQGVPAASGANSTVLGVRGPKAERTSDAIDGTMTADVNVDPVATATDNSPPGVPDAHTTAVGQGKKKKGGQDKGGLAAFLSRGQELKYDQDNQGEDASQTAGSALPSSLPSKPQFAGSGQEGQAASHAPPITQVIEGKTAEELTPQELYALRRGVRNEKGDVAYFLPSFIEDPWKDLVKN